MINVDDQSEEDSHSLYASLTSDVGWHTTLRAQPPVAGELGFAVDAILVSLAPGGVIAGVVAAVATWLSCRRSGEVTVRMTTADGRSVEVMAKQVRGLNPAELHVLVHRISETLDTAPAEQAPRPISSDADTH